MSPELLHYIYRVTPGTIALALFICLVPRNLKPLRIFAFILLFILFRDAMTPEGLWTITDSLEIRFIQQPSTLFLLALSSLVLVVISSFTIGDIRLKALWLKRGLVESALAGIFSGLVIALLPFIIRLFGNAPSSPKPEGLILVSSILALTFIGNLLEETLFRGHFQSWLQESKLSRTRIIFLSGGAFAICHSFLAFTVTSIGWPILIFTFYEGVVCAFLRDRNGLLAAALAHGTALFIMGCGLV